MSDDEAVPETRGVTVEFLTAVDLGPELEGMAGRQLRMRKITVEPGGFFTLHSHKDRPGTVYVLEGKIVEFTAKQTELEGYVAGLAARKREMESEIAAFVSVSEPAARSAGSAGPGASVAGKAERRADQAQQAFERAMGSPAGARPDRETAARLHELDRLSRSSKVAERLAHLKSGTQG